MTPADLQETEGRPETIGGLPVRVDPRMPVGWIAMLNEGNGSWAASNGDVVVTGNARQLTPSLIHKMVEAIRNAPPMVVVPVVSHRGNIVGEMEIPASSLRPSPLRSPSDG